MGMAGKFIQNNERDRSKNGVKGAFIAAIFCFILSIGIFCGDMYIRKNYAETPAVIVRIHHGSGTGNGTHAIVRYTYNGENYESALNTYNAFTMKEGKKLNVYINPKRPDLPSGTSRAMSVFAAAIGMIFWIAALKIKNDR